MSTPQNEPNPPGDGEGRPSGQEQPQYGQNLPQYGQNAPQQPGSGQPQYGQNAPQYGRACPSTVRASRSMGRTPRSTASSPMARASRASLRRPAVRAATVRLPERRARPVRLPERPAAVRRQADPAARSGHRFLADHRGGGHDGPATADGSLNRDDEIAMLLKNPDFRRAMEQQGGQVSEAQLAEVLNGFYAVTLTVVGVIAVGLYLLVAFGVKAGKNWARITGTVFAALSLLGPSTSGSARWPCCWASRRSCCCSCRRRTSSSRPPRPTSTASTAAKPVRQPAAPRRLGTGAGLGVVLRLLAPVVLRCRRPCSCARWTWPPNCRFWPTSTTGAGAENNSESSARSYRRGAAGCCTGLAAVGRTCGPWWPGRTGSTPAGTAARSPRRPAARPQCRTRC